MKGEVIAEKYGVNQDYFEEYAQLSGIGHRSSFSGFSMEDEKVADAIKGYTIWLNNKMERDAQEKIARAKMEDVSNRQTAENNKKISNERERVQKEIRAVRKNDFIVYSLIGCRGRKMKVYRDRCVISTDVTLGSIMTKNATDGEKTIFYADIIGIQYKEAGVLIGYLQLETGTAQMNNLSTNAFSENTFTFEENLSGKTSIAEIEEARDYIIYQVSKYKHPQICDSVLACATDDISSENAGNQDAVTPPESADKHDDPLIDSFVAPQSDVEAVLDEKPAKEPESSPITTPPSICPQCGNPINSDMLFCGNCGVRLHV